jgi:hypothetical protein
LDSNPTVDILDINGDPVSGMTALTTCLVTKGVYKVEINGLSSTSIPCLYNDLWKGLSINGVTISDVENEFVLLQTGGNFQIGSCDSKPKIYGFHFDGIKQNEKVLKIHKMILVKFDGGGGCA